MIKKYLLIFTMIILNFSAFANINLPIQRHAKVIEVNNNIIKTDIGSIKLANIYTDKNLTPLLSKLLLNKDIVIWEGEENEYDRYNNIIAHVTVDQIWLQEYLIKNNYAFVLPQNNSNNIIINKLYSVENIKPTQNIENITITNKFEIIDGIIFNAKLQKKHLYLNFDKDWKTGFTISIKKSDLKNFPKEYQVEDFWKNKKIRVRGFLEEYYGPIIKVQNYKQIQILK